MTLRRTVGWVLLGVVAVTAYAGCKGADCGAVQRAADAWADGVGVKARPSCECRHGIYSLRCDVLDNAGHVVPLYCRQRGTPDNITCSKDTP